MRGGIGLAMAAALALAGCGAVAPALPHAPAAALTTSQAPKIERFARVNDDLYRGGLPTGGQFTELRRLGIRTDVSLLGAGPASQRQVVAQEREEAEAAGLKFINVMVPYATPGQALIDRFMSAVRDPANQPVYVHCKHGRDRTGTMIALYRITEDGYSGQQAFAEMKTFGFDPDDYPYYAKLVLSFGP